MPNERYVWDPFWVGLAFQTPAPGGKGPSNGSKVETQGKLSAVIIVVVVVVYSSFGISEIDEYFLFLLWFWRRMLFQRRMMVPPYCTMYAVVGIARLL
jgi:hypothetical protein